MLFITNNDRLCLQLEAIDKKIAKITAKGGAA